MVNPGAFRGSCREFLIQQIELYIKAVEEGHAAECIVDIVWHYLKRYLVSLAHNVEPSLEALACINDNAPDAEIAVPDEDGITFEEYERQMKQYQEDRKTLKFRTEQIRRWLCYQYSKRHDMSGKDSGAENLWTVILHHLTGVGLVKPRKPQAFAVWFKANTTEVDDAWQLKTEELKKASKEVRPSQRAASFQLFKSKMYRQLLDSEKKSWEDLALEEHEAAMKEYEEKLKAPVSQDPKDLQLCLERHPSVLKPLIDIVTEATGCLVSIYVTGPQPANSGCPHITSFHGGKTLGSVKQTFVEAEHANFKKFILPIYGNFIKKCFTVEMCRERALPVDTPTLESIGFASDEAGVALDPVEGELFNVAGGLEPLPTSTSTTATTGSKTTSRPKKPLQEPPVKKTRDTSKTKTNTEGERAPASDRIASSTTSSEVPAEKNQGLQGEAASIPASSMPISPSSVPIPPSLVPIPDSSKEPEPAPVNDPSIPLSTETLSVDASKEQTSISLPASPAIAGIKSVVMELPVKPRVPEASDVEAKKACEPDRNGEKRQRKGVAKDLVDGGQSASKRQRVDEDVGNKDQSLQQELPSNAPKWAVSALKLFQRGDVPDQFLRLVERWLAFEVQENRWNDSGKLSAVDRPKPVVDWINRARTDRFHLQAVKSGVDPVKEFETKFWMWWSQLQPDFCLRDESSMLLLIGEDGHPDTKSEGSWDALRMPGSNGWVSIMVALCFWDWNLKGMKKEGYHGIAAAKHARAEWLKAIKDIDFVLGHLL